jgi:hypothetical protein
VPWFFGSRPEIERAHASYRNDSTPWKVLNRGVVGNVYGNQLAPGYAVYDTWSFHHENNGLDEDRDDLVDEGTNGLDDVGSYADTFVAGPNNPRLGPDDLGEREATPPNDRPLRGVQALLRVFERDSRQLRQVTVNQSFVPE